MCRTPWWPSRPWLSTPPGCSVEEEPAQWRYGLPVGNGASSLSTKTTSFCTRRGRCRTQKGSTALKWRAVLVPQCRSVNTHLSSQSCGARCFFWLIKRLYLDRMVSLTSSSLSQVVLRYNVPTPTRSTTLSIQVTPEVDCNSKSLRPRVTLKLESR